MTFLSLSLEKGKRPILLDLFKAKLINKSNGEIKILSQGKFKSVINLSVSYASKPAIDKVKKLGGNINLTKKVKGN